MSKPPWREHAHLCQQKLPVCSLIASWKLRQHLNGRPCSICNVDLSFSKVWFLCLSSLWSYLSNHCQWKLSNLAFWLINLYIWPKDARNSSLQPSVQQQLKMLQRTLASCTSIQNHNGQSSFDTCYRKEIFIIYFFSLTKSVALCRDLNSCLDWKRCMKIYFTWRSPASARHFQAPGHYLCKLNAPTFFKIVIA